MKTWQISLCLFFFLLSIHFSSPQTQPSCLASQILYNSQCFTRCSSTSGPNCIDCGDNCLECKSPSYITQPPQCSRCFNQSTTTTKTLFLYNYQCVEICPVSYDYSSLQCVNCTLNVTFQDTLNKVCLPCPDSCSDCGFSGCNTCAKGYMIYNNGRDCCLQGKEFFNNTNLTCQKCPNNCNSCDQTGKCTECNFDFQVSNLGCCHQGFYFNNAQQQCFQCLNICAACENEYSCSKCDNLTLYSSNMGCCSNGSFFDDDQLLCQQCPQNCSGCQNQLNCFACKPSYNLNSGHCCGSGEFYDSFLNICSKCSENCITCTNNQTCQTCQNTLITNGFCCPLSEFYSSQENKCLPCAESGKCMMCKDANLGDCLECYDNYTISSGFCCQNGFFFNATSLNCEICGTNCQICANASYCIKCNDFIALNSWENSCCDAGYFYDSTQQKCVSCSGNCTFCHKADTCLKCQDNFTLVNGSCAMNQNYTCYYLNNPKDCLKSCPSGYFSNNYHCLACNNACFECFGNATNCLSCQNGYIFSRNSCSTNCPSGQYLNITTKQCESCVGECRECFAGVNDACLSCQEGFYLKSTNCIYLGSVDPLSMNLSFSLTLMENQEIKIELDQEVVVPYYLNLTHIFDLNISGTDNYSEFLTYKIEKIDNKTMVFSMNSSYSLKNPQIQLTFNENCQKYVKNFANMTFNCSNVTKSQFFDNYYVYPDNFSNQISLINQFFIVIFYIILSLMTITWLFNPRRDSLLWYMIDSFQLSFYTLFLQLDFPYNLESFLLKLNVFNLDFLVYFGKKVGSNGEISFFNIEIESPSLELRTQSNIYRYLGTSNFIINAGWAFGLVLTLWSFYFISKFILNLFRFHVFSEQENTAKNVLSILDKIQQNSFFSFNLRISFFFLNTINFGAIAAFKHYPQNQSPFSLLLAISAVIFICILMFKSYQILNSPLVFNDIYQTNHYLTLFKDINKDKFLSRNHHLIVQIKKIANMIVIVFLSDFPLIALSFLIIIQAIGILRYIRHLPFDSIFINLICIVTNIVTFSYVCGLFRLEKLNQMMLEGPLIIYYSVMDSFIAIGFVCLSFIFMLNVIYLCVMVFIFFNTCAMNLDCICFFLILDEQNEEKIQYRKEDLEEKEEEETIDRKLPQVSKKTAKLINSFSNQKETNQYI